MDIYRYSSYKKYVNERVAQMPRNGHGQFVKIARHIGVSPVVVTQVLKGPREFSEEQALKLANFLGLSTLESEYFMRLIAMEKAGTHELKAFHRTAVEALRRQADLIKNRVAPHRELDDATKSVFYSDWTYSAVRLLTSIDRFRTPDALAERLDLSLARINEIVDFLVGSGLCIRTPSGKIERGVVSTHVDAHSRFVNSARRNWRLKGLEGLNRISADDIFYSGPCTISQEDFMAIKSEVIALTANLTKKIPDTEPEFLACLNIDWFKV